MSLTNFSHTQDKQAGILKHFLSLSILFLYLPCALVTLAKKHLKLSSLVRKSAKKLLLEGKLTKLHKNPNAQFINL